MILENCWSIFFPAAAYGVFSGGCALVIEDTRVSTRSLSHTHPLTVGGAGRMRRRNVSLLLTTSRTCCCYVNWDVWNICCKRWGYKKKRFKINNDTNRLGQLTQPVWEQSTGRPWPRQWWVFFVLSLKLIKSGPFDVKENPRCIFEPTADTVTTLETFRKRQK